jgi:DnaJ homolog subfamily C member 2
MPTFTKHEDLDWPEVAPTVIVECAGPGIFDFVALSENTDQIWEEVLAGDRDGDGKEADDNDIDDDGMEGKESSIPAVDLFSLSRRELNGIDFYQVLQLPCRPSITPDDVKKAYRKACLKYHPDKSGRGEEDAVFLKVKAAFETLSTQKQAYDSTEMPFDDELPDENPSDFFTEYGPAFERNLHFDARLLPSKQSKMGKQRNNKKAAKFHPKKPPSLGDGDTPIDKVHEFYDYWAHFESWRDFTLQAARELETEDHLENAESRYEKRWYQKEIDRLAKKLKQQEAARITTLVERAMAVDPRLIQERKRIIQGKEERQRRREQEALERKKAEDEAKKAEERRIEEERQKKADEKLQREKEKKQFRKVKQTFRRQVSGALEELLEKEHALENEVDLICNSMDRTQLSDLNAKFETKSAPEIVSLVKKHSQEIQNSGKEENGESHFNDAKSNDEPASITKDTPSFNPPTPKTQASFTQEELSALAKGVKKFPPGGANRWDQIANYINNLCRPPNPKTKEECIETYNRINSNKSVKSNSTGGSNNAAATSSSSTFSSPEMVTPAAATDVTADSSWTAEQDQHLQNGLATYPATMEKNERWTKIAKGVMGKTKKECVQRFKEIRNAIKESQKS